MLKSYSIHPPSLNEQGEPTSKSFLFFFTFSAYPSAPELLFFTEPCLYPHDLTSRIWSSLLIVVFPKGNAACESQLLPHLQLCLSIVFIREVKKLRVFFEKQKRNKATNTQTFIIFLPNIISLFMSYPSSA
jgi:hypothetical protein